MRKCTFVSLEFKPRPISLEAKHATSYTVPVLILNISAGLFFHGQYCMIHCIPYPLFFSFSASLKYHKLGQISPNGKNLGPIKIRSQRWVLFLWAPLQEKFHLYRFGFEPRPFKVAKPNVLPAFFFFFPVLVAMCHCTFSLC